MQIQILSSMILYTARALMFIY